MKIKQLITNKKLYWILICGFIFGVMYILNHYYPYIYDDYIYMYIWNLSGATKEHISSVKDILYSQLNHYQIYNGRFPSHVIVQLFAGLLGKSIFDIFNSFIFLLLCITFSKLVLNRYSLQFVLIAFGLFFLDFPYPGQTVFWLSGSINYLWTTTFSFIFLIKFQRSLIFEKKYKIICWSIFAIIAGWMNESVSIPMTMGLIIYSFFNFKNLSYIQKIGICCYCLGCILICFSPATFLRISDNSNLLLAGDTNIITFMFTRTLNMFMFFIKHPIPLIVLIIVAFSLFFKKYESNKQIIKNEQLFIIVFLCNTLFLWGLNMSNERIFFFYDIISWILLFRIWSHFNLKNKFKKYFWIINLTLFLCLIYGICKAYKCIKSYYEYDCMITNHIKDMPEETVFLEIPFDEPENRFTCVKLYGMNVSCSQTNWANFRPMYYHKKYIVSLPIEIWNFIQQEKYKEQMTIIDVGQEDIKCYNINNDYCLLQILNTNSLAYQINYSYENTLVVTEPLLPHQIIIRKLLGTYHQDKIIRNSLPEKYRSFELNGYSYIIMPYRKYIDLKCERMES